MYCVYIIQSEKTKRFYIGHTENVEDRLQRHNLGEVLSTKGYRPWKLIYTEVLEDRGRAMKRERYLKSQKSRRYLESLVQRFTAG